jgi:HEAT repeat protein
MSAIKLAAILSFVLVALAAVPAAWILTRETLRRARERRALREIEAAGRLVADGKGAAIAEIGKALSERFNAVTVERVVVQRLRDPDPAARAFGAELFVACGLVERYAKRLREAPKWSERTYAAEVLGLAAPAAAVPALVAALRDRYEDNASVKVAAAGALAALRDPNAIPLLVRELVDVDETSSRNVAEALAAFGALAVPALLELLLDTAHPAARVWAARILGRIGDNRATDALVARLHDRDDLLRMAAAEALGEIRDGRALQPLVRATLRDPAPQVRAHAAGAVAKIEGERALDVLVAALADPDYVTRLRALEAFETMHVTDTSSLEASLRDPNVEVRRRAGLALERVGYLDKVIASLTASERQVQMKAYAALLELGRVGLVDSIASYVHHPSFEVRALAARACGELGAARVTPLVASATEDDEWPVRAAACEALGRLQDERGVAKLVQRLTDTEEAVREAAVEALTVFSAKDLAAHADAIAASYSSASVVVRKSAVTLMARLEGTTPDEMLVRASVDPSDGVRLCAVRALGERGREDLVPAIVARLTDSSIEVRMAAVTALGAATTPEAFEGLLRALTDAPPDARERIADALSRGARGLLFSRLGELEKSALEVRLGVAWTLGKTGEVAAVPVLARFLRDGNPKLRASAAGALAKIPCAASLEALLPAGEDPDERVRAAVVNALGRVRDAEPRVLSALDARTHDPDQFVRDRALVALARVGRASVEARVLAARADVSEPARLVASAIVGTEASVARALDDLGRDGVLERVKAFLRHEEPAVRVELFKALHLDVPDSVEATPQEARALVGQYETLLRTSLDVEARRLAVLALARLRTERAVEVLADALMADPNERVRMHATEALHPHADHDAARRALARAISDPNPQVAICAVNALAGRREEEVSAALLRRLGAGAPEVRAAVEAALALRYRSDLTPFVDWMMGNDVPELLTPAVRVLEAIADPVTFPLLSELARSRSPALRSASVRAMGALGTPEAAARIDSLAQDPSEDVRLAVLDVMTLGSDSVLRTASLRRDPSVEVRARAAAALERTTGAVARQAVKALEAMLDDVAARVRAAALASLAAISEPEGLRIFGRAWPETSLDTRLELRAEPRAVAATGRLSVRLTTSSDSAERRCAVLAIGALGAPRFHEHVLPALRDPSPEVRIAAVQALAPVDDEVVRARLGEMLSDPDLAVRDAARRSMLRTVG